MKKLLFLLSFCIMSAMAYGQDVLTNESDDVEALLSDSLEAAGVQNVITVVKTVRFGYLSYSRVMEQMDEYKEAMLTISGLRAAYDSEVRRSEENFSKLFAEYIEGQQSFPENILLKRQKELQQAMDESIRFKNEARKILEEREEDVMNGLRNKIEKVLNELGKQRHYAFIINTDGDTYPFVNPEMGDDLTSTVVQMLIAGSQASE